MPGKRPLSDHPSFTDITLEYRFGFPLADICRRYSGYRGEVQLPDGRRKKTDLWRLRPPHLQAELRSFDRERRLNARLQEKDPVAWREKFDNAQFPLTYKELVRMAERRNFLTLPTDLVEALGNEERAIQIYLDAYGHDIRAVAELLRVCPTDDYLHALGVYLRIHPGCLPGKEKYRHSNLVSVSAELRRRSAELKREYKETERKAKGWSEKTRGELFLPVKAKLEQLQDDLDCLQSEQERRSQVLLLRRSMIGDSVLTSAARDRRCKWAIDHEGPWLGKKTRFSWGEVASILSEALRVVDELQYYWRELGAESRRLGLKERREKMALKFPGLLITELKRTFGGRHRTGRYQAACLITASITGLRPSVIEKRFRAKARELGLAPGVKVPT